MHPRHLLAWLTALVLFLCASVAYGADVNTSGLRQAVKAENVFEHQGDL
jgi:hypothetical protein